MSVRHACLACAEAASAGRASLALTGRLDALVPEYVTDAQAGAMVELQVTVGEGPGLEALASGKPVLTEDLAAPASARRWPAFAHEAVLLGTRAVYSIPLALGAIRVGVLELYGETPHVLQNGILLDTLVYADTALLLLLDARSGIVPALNGENRVQDAPPLWHAEVHQAAGMISVQLGISVLDALVRLRAYAYGHDQKLAEVARSVVERRLRFRPDEAGTPDDGEQGKEES